MFNFFFVAFFLLYIIIFLFLRHPFFKSALISLYFFLIVLLSSIHFPSNGQDYSSSPTQLIRPTSQIDPKEIVGSNGSFRRESNVATKHALLQHSFPSKEKPYNTYIYIPSLSLSLLQSTLHFLSHKSLSLAVIPMELSSSSKSKSKKPHSKHFNSPDQLSSKTPEKQPTQLPRNRLRNRGVALSVNEVRKVAETLRTNSSARTDPILANLPRNPRAPQVQETAPPAH